MCDQQLLSVQYSNESINTQFITINIALLYCLHRYVLNVFLSGIASRFYHKNLRFFLILF